MLAAIIKETAAAHGLGAGAAAEAQRELGALMHDEGRYAAVTAAAKQEVAGGKAAEDGGDSDDEAIRLAEEAIAKRKAAKAAKAGRRRAAEKAKKAAAAAAAEAPVSPASGPPSPSVLLAGGVGLDLPRRPPSPPGPGPDPAASAAPSLYKALKHGMTVRQTVARDSRLVTSLSAGDELAALEGRWIEASVDEGLASFSFPHSRFIWRVPIG